MATVQLLRYAITGSSVEQVKSAGGIDVKETRSTGRPQ
jgi:hypothetical protein